MVITRHRISWIFSANNNYEYGQFLNDDYWIVGKSRLVGNVEVIGDVEPIGIIPEYGENIRRIINGSMINPSPLQDITQGYDNVGLY